MLHPSALILSYHLIHRALPRLFLRPPAEKLRAMAEAALRVVVVLDLADQLGTHRLPFTALFRCPSRRAAGDAHLERVFACQRFKPFRKRGAIIFPDRRGVADVDEASFFVIKTEQERADLARPLAVAEAADDAVGGLEMLDLDHPLAVAGVVRLAEALGHHAIESGAAELIEPVAGQFAVGRGRRKADRRSFRHAHAEMLQLFSG